MLEQVKGCVTLRYNCSELKIVYISETMRLNPIYDEFSKLHENLIPRHLIEIKYELASGQFGKVFKGNNIMHAALHACPSD